MIAGVVEAQVRTSRISSTMRAAVLYGKEDVRLEEVPVPSPGPGELLIRVRTALTCGTDVKVYLRGYHALMIQPPALFGHELAGDIVALGPPEDRKGGDASVAWQVGQRVTCANSAPCDVCFYCRRGQPNLCDDLLFVNGAYAEYIRIPARIAKRNTYPIPDDLDYRDAALAEPLACVVRGLEESGVQPGDTVAVMGLGPIGLMFVRVASQVYGARVLALARRLPQVDRAMLLGASEGILFGDPDATIAEVRAQTGGRGADIVIEAVGQPSTWELAPSLVRRGGSINFFGGCAKGTKVKLDTALLHYGEITCRASFHHTPRHIRKALDYISDGRVSARELVTHEEPLEELPRVLDDLAHRRNGHIKTAIVP